jgi:hypothetical protein
MITSPWRVRIIGKRQGRRDADGQALSGVYYEPGRRSAAKLLTKDAARRIAANIATPPELLQKP